MTAGTGRLRVVASDNNLGDLGPREGEPLFVHWGWYYSLPGLAMWIVLAVLLVVPKHNRTFHAWLILVLPAAVSGLTLLTRCLFPAWPVEFDGVETIVCAFAGAWAGVWLLGPWLSHGGGMRVSALTLVAMFAFGVVGYVGYFGFWVSDELLLPLFLSWTVCSVALVAAMALIGWSCRKILRPAAAPALAGGLASACFRILCRHRFGDRIRDRAGHRCAERAVQDIDSGSRRLDFLGLWVVPIQPAGHAVEQLESVLRAAVPQSLLSVGRASKDARRSAAGGREPQRQSVWVLRFGGPEVRLLTPIEPQPARCATARVGGGGVLARPCDSGRARVPVLLGCGRGPR